MTTTADGYFIEQYPKRNMIIIGLPQTNGSLTNTITQLSGRRTNLTSEEEAQILLLVKAWLEGKK